MPCPRCDSAVVTKDGTTQLGGQRFRCGRCGRRFTRRSSSAFSRRAFSDDIIALAVRWYVRYRLSYTGVSASPTAAWVWRQVIEATPWGRTPRHLLRDRDAVYGRDFRQRARRIGIDAIATPIHAPKANAIVERVIGTLRRECLDHIVVLNEQHLMAILHEFVRYYHQERPHRTLGLETPQRTLRPVTGAIRSHPILNGLHHVYERAA